MSKTASKQLAELVGQEIARQRIRCQLSQEQIAERAIVLLFSSRFYSGSRRAARSITIGLCS
ncbi:hypothetical protein D3C77_54690 [compost metagenome]